MKLTEEELKVHRYRRHLGKFVGMIPLKGCLKQFHLTLVKKTNGTSVFQCNKWTLTEKKGSGTDVFPLTNSEILSVLNYYGLHEVDITVFHQKLVEVQAFMTPKVGKVRSTLTLKIPSELALRQKFRKECGIEINSRLCALHTLLHEISHLLGNTFVGEDCEDEADRFGYQEVKKWVDVIDCKEDDDDGEELF